jgi:membrane-associated protein
MLNPIDFILHVDKYLGLLINSFGYFTYLVLFLIVFIETGLVITPFFPGDSLLFISGAFAASGFFNIFYLFILFFAAAVLGDTVNYWIGDFFGEKVFLKLRFIKKYHLDKTKDFYERHGGKTIVLARFVPIVRTFAPFIAGVGKMKYKNFFFYNIIGGFIWTSLFLFSGYFFGKIPIVEKNLTLVIYIIIFVSIIPILIEFINEKRKAKKNRSE